MRNIISYDNISPEVEESSYVNLHSIIVGNVKIGQNCSIWPGAIICAFDNEIQIGDNVVVMNKCILTTTDLNPLVIGENTLISQSATLRGCRIGKNVLIGKGATVPDGAVIGDRTILYPNTMVLPHMDIPEGKLIAEAPANMIRDVTEQEIAEVQDQLEKLKDKAKEFGSYFNMSVED
jgi:carbonic anhydrase/acetyltransferase-like protein (isoleucine patch superfamily)